jgi:hypothetical protein
MPSCPMLIWISASEATTRKSKEPSYNAIHSISYLPATCFNEGSLELKRRKIHWHPGELGLDLSIPWEQWAAPGPFGIYGCGTMGMGRVPAWDSQKPHVPAPGHQRAP